MIRLAALLALLALPAAAQDVADKPRWMAPFPEDKPAEFLAVGRVNKTGFRIKGSCSGTLVAPDIVLTAAHCTQLDTDPAMKRLFVAGRNRGEYVAARPFRKQVRHPEYLKNGQHDPRFDLGLLFLDEPITEVAPIPLALPGPAPQAVAVMGYHQKTPYLLSGRLDCATLRANIDLMVVDCPVISGNSGGPALRQFEDGTWQVEGVVSSQFKDKAIVVRVTDWVHRTISAER